MRPEGYSFEEGGDAIMDLSEVVPSSVAPIVPILRAANEIEQENPRVAYLCRFTAFEKAHIKDPNSSGRGVRQFKTYLLHRLEKFVVAAGTATPSGPERHRLTYPRGRHILQNADLIILSLKTHEIRFSILRECQGNMKKNFYVLNLGIWLLNA